MTIYFHVNIQVEHKFICYKLLYFSMYKLYFHIINRENNLYFWKNYKFVLNFGKVIDNSCCETYIFKVKNK